MDGYIKLNRVLLEWDWHDEPKTAWLYVVMLMLANHEEGRWRGETLRRGQLLTGRNHLSVASGLTENEVRTALQHLRKTGDIDVASKNKYSVITLLRYDEHCTVNQQTTSENPGKPPAVPPAKPPADHQQITSRSPADHHIQELKELKELKKEDVCAHASSNDEDDLLDRIADYNRAQSLISRHRLNDSETTLEALLEDAEEYGWDALEEALKTACLKDNRGGVSVAYYRAILANNGTKSQEGYDPYAGVRVIGG